MKLPSNGLKFEVLSEGAQQGTPVVLIMGLGMQLTAWPRVLVDSLLAHGHRVIRFDNRDIGLSSHLDHLRIPNLVWQTMRQRMGWRVQCPYSLADMARDTLGLLDALDIERAHVVGVSMGGMIAQRLAVTSPTRVSSLTSVMSSSGAPELPGPTPEVMQVLLQRPRSRDPEDVAEQALRVFEVIGSPAYPQDMAMFRAHLIADARRSYHPAGVLRQLLAVMGDHDRHRLLRQVECPTLVIHGTEDRLVPMECGQDTAARIAGSRFESIEGMGHDWPPAVAERMTELIIPHLRQAGSTR